MSSEPMRAETDVLVIGAGGAGMYAAIEAARAGCRVMLVDRSLIGRGGATVMAQMTVAVALGAETPDHWSHHYADTLTAGRGLCAEPLARLLCEEGPDCIREIDAWGIGWARKDGRIVQAQAPGHDRRPHAALSPQQRVGQHGRRRLRARAARRRVARRNGVRAVLPDRPSGAA